MNLRTSSSILASVHTLSFEQSEEALSGRIVCATREPERQQREKTACHPGQGADHENQGEKALPQILEPHPRRLDLRHELPRRFVPRLGLRHIALQVPVAGKHRFLQLDRFRIEAPRFSERLMDARHRLGPTSRSGPRAGRVERAGLILMGSYLEHVTGDDPGKRDRLMKGLDVCLERDRDRKLFDLAPNKEISDGNPG